MKQAARLLLGSLLGSLFFAYQSREVSAVPQDVVWTSFVNASANGNTLVKSPDNATGGAVSAQTITSGDGYVQFTAAESTTNRGAGLSHGNTDEFRDDIDYVIQLTPFGSAEFYERVNEFVYEYRGEETYIVGDVFRVEAASGFDACARPGTCVLYRKLEDGQWNKVISVGSPTYPLLVDAFMDVAGATIANAVISNGSTGGSPWPNEPAGMTLHTEWGFDQDPPTSGDVAIPGSPGWRIVGNAPPGGPEDPPVPPVPPDPPTIGWVVRDSVANVYDFVYPRTMREGSSPAAVYTILPTAPAVAEVYAAFWWKPSFPFDLDVDGNKIAFMFNGGGGSGGQQFLIMKKNPAVCDPESTSPGLLSVSPEHEDPFDNEWRHPNMDTTCVELGVWHLIEWYSNRLTGELKWWIGNGSTQVLQGHYGPAPGGPLPLKNNRRFDEFKLDPTFGGNSDHYKTQRDHYWFDHVRVSIR